MSYLGITGTMRTDPTAAKEVLGLPPLHLQVEITDYVPMTNENPNTKVCYCINLRT
jgi:hypothetical protein